MNNVIGMAGAYDHGKTTLGARLLTGSRKHRTGLRRNKVVCVYP